MEEIPKLVILATDPLAGSVAMEYARECEDANYPKWYVEQMFDLAYKIRKWQSENKCEPPKDNK